MPASSLEESAPTSQRERQRVETRERLFQAALAEFRRVGFGEAQIPAIAEAAGVVRGTFYFHFPSKEDVLLELVSRREAELASGLVALRGQGASLESILGGLLEAMEPEDEGSPELVRETVAMQLRTPLDPHERPQGHVVFEALLSLFEELVARGEIRSDIPVERVVTLVLTSVFGMAIARGASPGDDRHASSSQQLALLLPGLRPPGTDRG